MIKKIIIFVVCIIISVNICFAQDCQIPNKIKQDLDFLDKEINQISIIEGEIPTLQTIISNTKMINEIRRLGFNVSNFSSQVQTEIHDFFNDRSMLYYSAKLIDIRCKKIRELLNEAINVNDTNSRNKLISLSNTCNNFLENLKNYNQTKDYIILSDGSKSENRYKYVMFDDKCTDPSNASELIKYTVGYTVDFVKEAISFEYLKELLQNLEKNIMNMYDAQVKDYERLFSTKDLEAYEELRQYIIELQKEEKLKEQSIQKDIEIRSDIEDEEVIEAQASIDAQLNLIYRLNIQAEESFDLNNWFNANINNFDVRQSYNAKNIIILNRILYQVKLQEKNIKNIANNYIKVCQKIGPLGGNCGKEITN